MLHACYRALSCDVTAQARSHAGVQLVSKLQLDVQCSNYLLACVYVWVADVFTTPTTLTNPSLSTSAKKNGPLLSYQVHKTFRT